MLPVSCKLVNKSLHLCVGGLEKYMLVSERNGTSEREVLLKLLSFFSKLDCMCSNQGRTLSYVNHFFFKTSKEFY